MSAGERPALLRQHEAGAPPGLLIDWARSRGVAVQLHRTWTGEPEPDLTGRTFIVSLGSSDSPADRHLPAVRAELDALARALELDVPVLGLCFGGQALAAVLGATVGPAERPEVGWHPIDTDDPRALPAGPWLQWHYQRFDVPPGAVELARSPSGPQAFRAGRHLGVQFHPEATPDIVAGWAREDRDQLRERGLGDGEELVAAGAHLAAAAARNAFTLFDAFWATAYPQARCPAPWS